MIFLHCCVQKHVLHPFSSLDMFKCWQFLILIASLSYKRLKDFYIVSGIYYLNKNCQWQTNSRSPVDAYGYTYSSVLATRASKQRTQQHFSRNSRVCHKFCSYNFTSCDLTLPAEFITDTKPINRQYQLLVWLTVKTSHNTTLQMPIDQIHGNNDLRTVEFNSSNVYNLSFLLTLCTFAAIFTRSISGSVCR